MRTVVVLGIVSGVEVIGVVIGVVAGGRVEVSGTTVVVTGGGVCGKERAPSLADSFTLTWSTAEYPSWRPSTCHPSACPPHPPILPGYLASRSGGKVSCLALALLQGSALNLSEGGPSSSVLFGSPFSLWSQLTICWTTGDLISERSGQAAASPRPRRYRTLFCLLLPLPQDIGPCLASFL